MAELRGLRRTEVTAVVRGPVPDLGPIAAAGSLMLDPAPDTGNTIAMGTVTSDDTCLRFTLTATPSALLRALAPADVVSLQMHEPGLEEIFLGYYEAAARVADHAGRAAR